MEIENLNWEMSELQMRPPLCAVCEEKAAELKVTFQHREVTVKLCLCPECVKLPETILIERIFGRQYGTK